MKQSGLPLDTQQLNQLRQQHLGRLLLRTYRAFSSRAVEKLNDRGYEGLAVAHTTLLMNIDVEGTRHTTLADRIGVSRQAVGKLVDNLEQRGYVARESDSSDKRAVIVTLTDEGWRLIGVVVEIKNQIEAEFRDILGEKEMKILRSGLTKLLEKTDVSGPTMPHSN